jgi:hypothetical protein
MRAIISPFVFPNSMKWQLNFIIHRLSQIFQNAVLRLHDMMEANKKCGNNHCYNKKVRFQYFLADKLEIL